MSDPIKMAAIMDAVRSSSAGPDKSCPHCGRDYDYEDDDHRSLDPDSSERYDLDMEKANSRVANTDPEQSSQAKRDAEYDRAALRSYQSRHPAMTRAQRSARDAKR